MDYKNALITGASSGLGRGLAAWFAKRNVRVYAAARRIDQLEALKKEVGDNIVPLKLDVSDGDATEARVRKLDEECGGLDLVVANAGVGEQSYGKRIDWSKASRMIQVNVLGATATICGALPGMVERKRGHLVGVSSIAAYGGMPRMGVYCGTKAYLATFLQGLRHDVEKLGITVTSLHPGFVKSEMTANNEKMPFLLETDDAVERMGQSILRGDASFAFPWQMSLTMKSMSSLLPRPLFEAALKKMG